MIKFLWTLGEFLFKQRTRQEIVQFDSSLQFGIVFN